MVDFALNWYYDFTVGSLHDLNQVLRHVRLVGWGGGGEKHDAAKIMTLSFLVQKLFVKNCLGPHLGKPNTLICIQKYLCKPIPVKYPMHFKLKARSG